MAVVCTGKDREISIAISGEVDHHRAREIFAALDREIDGALPRKAVLDLGGVSFMDSSGIAVVLRCHKRMCELGGAMTVANVPNQAGKVLKAAGLERLVKFE